MWYSYASFEVEGNWNKLTKKFCEKFFPISKVQHLRRQVITFTQGEEEGIDQAWNRFNELIEQGPRLGFSSDVLLHIVDGVFWYTKHVHYTLVWI
jgi:hypothetical protein